MNRVLIPSGVALLLALLVLRGSRATHEHVVASAPGERVAASVAAKPASEPAAPASRPRTDGTTIVVLRLRQSGASLVSFADKSFAFAPESGGSALWILEDAESGRELARGPCELPTLCDCPIGHDHAVGCVMVRHEAVFRLKVPRLARSERLRLLSARGRDLGAFVLEPLS
jgi:hypothetical protein